MVVTNVVRFAMGDPMNRKDKAKYGRARQRADRRIQKPRKENWQLQPQRWL